ncbi:hypothetical protein BRY73_09195 [Ochrobactrum sp. P6BS-III]|nr:hypothetical protein BRY73_09195 [Ochrobactrum sp. P6BS-III]
MSARAGNIPAITAAPVAPSTERLLIAMAYALLRVLLALNIAVCRIVHKIAICEQAVQHSYAFRRTSKRLKN